MHTTGTHIAYFHLCHRKLWLFAMGIKMEQTSTLVAEGKLIGETSYLKRSDKWKELELEGIKIDYFDARRGIVREVKKSSKREEAHIAQVKYYLWVLEQNNITASHAVLEYPKLRTTEEIWLTAKDAERIPGWVKKIKKIISQKDCPKVMNTSLCKRCAYFDFCYIEE